MVGDAACRGRSGQEGAGVLIARWLRREREQAAAPWRADVRRGFRFGARLGGALAAWLGLR